jgi:hypothetical protein
MNDDKDIVSQLEHRNVQEKEQPEKEIVIKIKEDQAAPALDDRGPAARDDQAHHHGERAHGDRTAVPVPSKDREAACQEQNQMEKDMLKLRRELQISRKTEQELAKRALFYQKLVKKLHEKLKNKDDRTTRRRRARTTTCRRRAAWSP